jgi:hypothetical protein
LKVVGGLVRFSVRRFTIPDMKTRLNQEELPNNN